MIFDQQLKEIAKIQKEFGESAMEILLGMNHADAILMKNIGRRFLSALLDEVEREGKKVKYQTLNASQFIYVTSRIDDNDRQQIYNLTNKYLDARITIDNT